MQPAPEKNMKMRIAVVFAIAGLAAATVQAQDAMVKPLQTIQFKANAYGCRNSSPGINAFRRRRTQASASYAWSDTMSNS
jgi:hypothetical protein